MQIFEHQTRQAWLEIWFRYRNLHVYYLKTNIFGVPCKYFMYVYGSRIIVLFRAIEMAISRIPLFDESTQWFVHSFFRNFARESFLRRDTLMILRVSRLMDAYRQKGKLNYQTQ